MIKSSIAGFLLIVISQIVVAQDPNQHFKQQVKMQKGNLSVWFQDNANSPAELSGMASLFNVQDAPNFDAYDPDTKGASAGLNFEHIISGHKNPNNKFTPRYGTYRLQVISVDTVKLVRRAADSPWSIDSEFEYRLVAPHYVDFKFRCTPRDAAKFGERGYAVFFFANYMNDVVDSSLNFLAKTGHAAAPTWVSENAPAGHPDWSGGGNYRAVAAKPLEYDEDVEFRLNTWSYEWPRIAQPMYYGRAEKGMTLMLMFDRLHSRRDQIRFSLYKFKMSKWPRPAWDFQYVINQVQADQEYGFQGGWFGRSSSAKTTVNKNTLIGPSRFKRLASKSCDGLVRRCFSKTSTSAK